MLIEHNVIRLQGELGEILHQHTQFLGVYLVASCENTPHLLASRHGSDELLLIVSTCLSLLSSREGEAKADAEGIFACAITYTISLQPFVANLEAAAPSQLLGLAPDILVP